MVRISTFDSCETADQGRISLVTDPIRTSVTNLRLHPLKEEIAALKIVKNRRCKGLLFHYEALFVRKLINVRRDI